MKLKEKRYHLVINYIKEWLLNSDKFIGVTITTEKIPLKSQGFTPEVILGSLRYLLGKGYFEPCSKSDELSLDSVKLTQQGMDEWLFHEGLENHKRIFLSHASK